MYLFSDPTNPNLLPGKGPIPSDLAMVGICPSTRRPSNRRFEPFGAGSWNFLSKILREANLSREEIYVTNAVKEAFDPGKKPQKKIVREHYPLLMKELKVVKPRRILAVGALPAELLCPGFSNLREDHGSIFYNPEIECEVVPTYHFSAIARTPSLRSLFDRDFERFLTTERREAEPIKKVRAVDLHSTFSPEEPLFLDIETTGLDDEKDDILMIGLRQSGQNYYIGSPTEQEVIETLEWLDHSAISVVGHNLPFDLYFLFRKAKSAEYDLDTRDTMLMAHIAGEDVKSLKHLATTFTDSPGSHAFGGPGDPAYLAEDLVSTDSLYQIFNQKVGDLLITELVNKLSLYVTKMRYSGVHIDYQRLSDLKPHIESQVEDMKSLLDSIAGEPVNWNSTPQTVKFLQSQKVHLIEKTPTGNYSVKESVLVDLAKDYPVAQKILNYREAKKELEFFESYLEKTTADHPFLHPKLHLAGTRTGRLSCSSPNLQQVKRTGPIKTIFTPRYYEGYIGLIDLSQAELRVAALLADDDDFAEALLSDDVHLVVSSMIYNKKPEAVTKAERKASKAITFGLLYGGSPVGLSQRSGLTVETVKKVVSRLYDKYPGLEKHIQDSQREALRAGYIVSPFGRVRDLKGLIQEFGKQDAARKAINTPIQSAASDIGLVIMYFLNHMIYKYNARSRVIFGVHDSVLLDIHPNEVVSISGWVQMAFRILGQTPLSKYRLFHSLPIIGDLVIGKSWAAVEETNENYDPNNLIFPCSSLQSKEQ